MRGVLFIGLTLVFFPLAILGAAIPSTMLWVFWGLVATAGLLFASFLLPKELVSNARDLRMIENPDDSEVCLVEIGVWEGLRCEGDRGVVWLDQNRLLFTGHRCSFVIGGQDILSEKAWNDGRTSDESFALPSHALLLQSLGPRRMVTFEPLSRTGPLEAMQRAYFQHRFARFRDEAPPSDAPRQWPPFEP